MDELGAAVIRDVKNRLAELALLLGRRGDCGKETGIVLGAARQLTSLLIAHREQAGSLAVNIDSATPAELLGELAEEYRVLFPALNIEFGGQAAPAFWFYDEALVRLALANAVHNACRHAHSGVRLEAFEDQGRLVFEVADDGPGFPPETREHPDGELPHSQSGTGLGLYLAQRIAALHVLKGRAGEVELVNRDGACFRLILP